MAIYNAYGDRVPIYIILGNISMAGSARRRGMGAQRPGRSVMVRDYTKWDDSPVSLGHFAESAVRAYKIAMTPPMAGRDRGRRGSAGKSHPR